MSNIYIQEPPTSGKVLLKTSVGDLELELWTKEAPKACRNFIQLCMEGYYNGTIFHRVVKGFICQGGDPTGTGQGGESIYGQPFKDEIHTRLRFCRRGLLAMANAGKDDNSSQFFFTFSATPELQNKHTIFGKVAGETIYNMLKLEDAIVDANERPTYPQKIIKTEILLNPFVDIVPRCDPSIKNKLDNDNDKKKKQKKVGVKNFKLLSFGEEAEEDEEESVELSKKYIGKGKSAHDSLSDPKLSSVLAIEVSGDLSCKKRKRDEIQQDKNSNDDDDDDKEEEEECVKKESKEMKERIISKLQDKKKYSKSDLKKSKSDLVVKDNEEKEDDEEEEEEYYFGKDRDDENKKKVEAIQKEIREFKKELKNEKFAKEEIERKKIQDIEKNNKKSDIKNKYIKTKEEFMKAKSKIPEKGVSREKATQELLMKFRNKLKSVKQQNDNVDTEDKNKNKNKNDDDDDDFVSDASWMTSVLHCEEKKQPVLAKDASTKDDDWFEIYDPRNPINKRRRGDNTNNSLNNKSKKLNSSTKETTRRGGTRY